MDLKAISRNDQATAELDDTIRRVCVAYRMMTASGIADEHAARMVAVYNALLLARHFDIPPYGISVDATAWEDDDV